MSGIFGIINKKGDPIDAEWMRNMANLLSHRGPDGEGLWVENEVGLGHKLLITTPESQFENQPYHHERWIITADARIDNKAELIKLLDINADIQTLPDSILILKSYEKWKNKCCECLIGDFAFVIWDKLEKTIFCASDHTGVRQLYYYESATYFIFATEIRAIAELKIVPKQLNESKLKDFLLFIYLGGRFEAETFFVGIKKIMPAHYLILQNGSSKCHNYWKPQTKKKLLFKDKRDYGFALRELIEQAVSDRIRTNYNVGIELSGGLDSSSIACIAARQLKGVNRLLYSASSVMPLNHKGIEEDERHYIDTVLAQEKNIKPFFVSAPNSPVFKNMEKQFTKTYAPVNAFHYMDDALHQTLAENANARIILSGYVGDRTVSNQARTALVHLFRQGNFKTLMNLIKQRSKVYDTAAWRIFIYQVILKLLPPNMVTILKKITGSPINNLFDIKAVSINPDFLTPAEREGLKSVFDHLNRPNEEFWEDLWTLNELWFDVEMDARISYFKQEPAYPFADKRIIDFLFNVPVQHFLANGWNRGLIRKAMDGVLPTKIQYRKDKSPFSPDYQSRVIKEFDFIEELLAAEEYNAAITEKVDFQKINDKLRNTTSSKNVKDFDNTTVTLLFNGISGISFLKWFEKF